MSNINMISGDGHLANDVTAGIHSIFSVNQSFDKGSLYINKDQGFYNSKNYSKVTHKPDLSNVNNDSINDV
jgi:hypothetical protein